MEAALLARVIAAPHDDAARMVYGDWLEQQGDRRAAYLALAGRYLRLVRTMPAAKPRYEATGAVDYIAEPVSGIAFTGRGTDLELVAAGRFAVRCWPLASPVPRWTIATADTSYGGCVAMRPDRAGLLTIAGDGQLVTRDLQTGKVGASWGDRLYDSRALIVPPGGDACVWGGSAIPGNSGGYSTTQVRVWDARTGAPRWTWDGEDWSSVRAVAVVDDRVLVNTRKSRPRVLGLADGLVRPEIQIEAFSALEHLRGGRVVLAFADPVRGRVAIWNARELRQIRETEVELEEPDKLAVTGGRRLVVVASGRGGRLALLRAGSLEILEYLAFDGVVRGYITSLASDADGDWFAVGMDTGEVHLFVTRPG